MSDPPPPTLTRSPIKRALLLSGGLLALGLGIAGILLPGLPGTPFLLVATWLFSLSNERLYRFMLTNRWFGKTLRDYRAGLGIPLHIKLVAITMAVSILSLSVIFMLQSWAARAAVIALGCYGVYFIAKQPTRPRE